MRSKFTSILKTYAMSETTDFHYCYYILLHLLWVKLQNGEFERTGGMWHGLVIILLQGPVSRLVRTAGE
jgi:hypothetical protein